LRSLTHFGLSVWLNTQVLVFKPFSFNTSVVQSIQMPLVWFVACTSACKNISFNCRILYMQTMHM